MNGATTATSSWADDPYPCSDEEPMAEFEAHLLAMVTLIVLLRQHFHGQSDVFVIGNMFWYYEEGNPLARKAPDLMVVKGVDPSPRSGRRSFKSWEERANPCFILELTSPSTATEDMEDKLELYQRLGVREYFLFDTTADLLDRPLVGYRLIGGAYEPLIAAGDGSMPSNELGLRLVPNGPELTLIDMRTGRRLENLPELAAQLRHVNDEVEVLSREIDRVRRADEEARLEVARQRDEAVRAADRADAEKARADAEKARADAEKARADAAEAEIARLKAVLTMASPPTPAAEGPTP
jgi:Uma2 family endonuclease